MSGHTALEAACARGCEDVVFELLRSKEKQQRALNAGAGIGYPSIHSSIIHFD